MNAQMRRIDLVCKLMGPLIIALIDGISTEVAILVNLGMNVASIPIEYFAIARASFGLIFVAQHTYFPCQVYYEVPELQQTKRRNPGLTLDRSSVGRPENEVRAAHTWRHVQDIIKKSVQDFGLYFRHRAFLPSFAGALLYLTVLSFAGQMVTYLLSAGYTSTQIGLVRTLSVGFEVLATWFAPWLMGKIGPVRAGLWLASWQITCLVTGIAVFWALTELPFASATGLVGGTILSRVGLRGLDLCIQIIIQEVSICRTLSPNSYPPSIAIAAAFTLKYIVILTHLQDVEAENRGVFSSVEAAWQNAFEICSHISTIVFSRPDQFKWPTLISVLAVVSAGVLYTIFVYLRRGHLLHLSKFDIFRFQVREPSIQQAIRRAR
jgi:solute carrier family 40 (iron-regulated transporter), member 1